MRHACDDIGRYDGSHLALPSLPNRSDPPGGSTVGQPRPSGANRRSTVSCDPGTAGTLTSFGAAEAFSAPIMAVRTADFPASAKLPPWLSVRRITGRAAMRDFVRSYSEPFGFPAEALDFIAERELDYATRSATALTLESIRAARENGAGIVTLQASATGAALYRAMGFHEVGRYHVYRFPDDAPQAYGRKANRYGDDKKRE